MPRAWLIREIWTKKNLHEVNGKIAGGFPAESETMSMEQMIKSASVYKLAILIGIMFSINALSLSTISALSGVDHWNTLTTTQKIVILAALIANWTNVMLAFFNKTLSRIEKGKLPVGHDTDPPFIPERRAP